MGDSVIPNDSYVLGMMQGKCRGLIIPHVNLGRIKHDSSIREVVYVKKVLSSEIWTTPPISLIRLGCPLHLQETVIQVLAPAQNQQIYANEEITNMSDGVITSVEQKEVGDSNDWVI